MNIAGFNCIADATVNINRPSFLQPASAVLPWPVLPFLERGRVGSCKRKNPGWVIGAGWYGPSDLWRLIQVRDRSFASADPIEMLHNAVEDCQPRQQRTRNRTFSD